MWKLCQNYHCCWCCRQEPMLRSDPCFIVFKAMLRPLLQGSMFTIEAPFYHKFHLFQRFLPLLVHIVAIIIVRLTPHNRFCYCWCASLTTNCPAHSCKPLQRHCKITPTPWLLHNTIRWCVNIIVTMWSTKALLFSHSSACFWNQHPWSTVIIFVGWPDSEFQIPNSLFLLFPHCSYVDSRFHAICNPCKFASISRMEFWNSEFGIRLQPAYKFTFILRGNPEFGIHVAMV